uniref:LAGLIDADG homing endonuclease n=1 Tax=Fuscoporia gilva TaxID=40471 RepID=UPI0023D850F3|nr:LAGLIDADG homing endonuclease [Fuscoporia gilva]WDD39638.1 LAGLIDADG homing endonuclease [Fuscoporia gilva]
MLALYLAVEIGAVLVLIQLYKIFIKINFIFFVKRLSSLFVCKAQVERPLFTNSQNKGTRLTTNIRKYSTLNRYDSLNEKGSIDSKFLEWFVGFTDAEGCFIINPFLKKNKLSISSFVFMFKITLHKDDEKVLRIIKDRLRIGGVRVYKDECIFSITKQKEISILISIFEKFNLNTSKYLDYLDFKEAYFLYFDRAPNLNPDSIKDRILGLKNNMNTNRILYDRPENSKIVITKSWLLGFIEGDGSFFLRRDNLTPIFSLENTAVQLPVMLKIKEFLEASLGFDKFSLYKVQNTQIIVIASRKARTINSKSTVSITIQHINVLNNYLIPFFENEEFLTKKGKDFYDFKIICKVIYEGSYRIEKIRALILKLSNTMNNFRLSTYNGEVKFLTLEELEILLNAEPTVIRLPDGRVIDSTTKKILPKLVCCVYEILTEYGSFILANSLSEAAKIVGLYPDTLSKYLDFNASLTLAERSAPNSTEDLTRKDGYVAIKKHFIKRVRVFTGQREAALLTSLRSEYGVCRQNKLFKD